jgi:hypothetical protein
VICRFPPDGFGKTQRPCWPTALQRDSLLLNQGVEREMGVGIASDRGGSALKPEFVAPFALPGRSWSI